MADKNLDGNGLNEVWTRAAQLVKKYTGAVDLTKGNLQTQVDTKITGTDDTKDNVITFTSADEANPSAWKDVNVLSSKEKHSSLFSKISTMFSNLRYLYKLIGTTDISALGTVTQALANLDGNVGDIKGIISSLADCSAATVAGYAADALAVKELNSNLDAHLPNAIYGYSVRGQFDNTNCENILSGTITVAVMNGIISIAFNNVACNPDTILFNLKDYIGNNIYAYDQNGTGVYIDAGNVYFNKASVDYLVFTYAYYTR